jgi:formate dehydrogenase
VSAAQFPPEAGKSGPSAESALGAENERRLHRRAHGRQTQVAPARLAELQGWLEAHFGVAPPRRELLIEYLHVIQDRLHGLPVTYLAALAQWMRLPQAEVHEVASFYHHFDIVPDGAEGGVPTLPALTARICDGLACEMVGARDLLQRLPAMLGREVRVVAAPCMGRCDAAPVVMLGQRPLVHATAQRVLAARQDGGVTESVNGHLGLDAYLAQGGYALWQACLAGQRDVHAVMQSLRASGLRGLGGAGFPAAQKWQIVSEQAGPRQLVVNIDEGEPGTFKDRWLLERDPHRLLEGALIAAWAVGAGSITLYLRDEYHGCRAMLQSELALLPAQPFAAQLPGMALRRGAGAYVCGEESALIESIEGKRGLPRLRPPYVAQRGLHGQATLVHNLETLYAVREILERPPGWLATHGRHGRNGLRRFSVSGRVCEPGVKLAPAGITLHELLHEFCGGMLPGHTLYAYLPGGASGGILPARLADVPLDFDTLQAHGAFIGSAAVTVLSQADRAVDAARNAMRFMAHESCGQCTPCRVGTVRASALMAQAQWDVPLLAELSQVMRYASICGLGQAAPNTLDCVLRYFAHELAP